jgi:hypothetical protein
MIGETDGVVIVQCGIALWLRGVEGGNYVITIRKMRVEM